MHITTTKNPIYLVHRKNGIVRTFKSFDETVKFWPWINNLKGTIGKEFKIDYSKWKHSDICARLFSNAPAIYNTYILRDSFGDNIDPRNIVARHNELFSRKGNYYTYVPGSKRSYRHGYGFRHPRTTYERRWADAWTDEEESPAPKIRARRNFRNLPSSWDDIPRRDWDNNNWKRFRRHQYKS